MFSKLDKKAISITTANFAASLLFSFFLTDTLANNTDALNLVANIFSILTGFLLLVITLSGENSAVSSGLSEVERVYQNTRFLMRFNKYYSLFLLYLLTLALIFIYYLLSKDKVHSGPLLTTIISMVTHSISFLTFFSFVQSTFIPVKLKQLYNEKKDLNKMGS
ncbi:hypothetical protein [Pantoea vagans]|uniref:hypothetical protein n=1 Tax=Pantoea vagans TaxID=470934 RepID=UPI0028EA5D52|nr:hypothetical protein [Pantoea vagans]